MLANARRLGEFAWLYLGPLPTLLLVLGVAGAWLRPDRLMRVLTGFALAWTALFVVSASNLSAHYLFAALPFYVLAMAWALVEGASAVERRVRGVGAPIVVAGALLLVALGSWPLLRALWNDPPSAVLADTERLQLVEGEWSGYGLPEAARWIERELRAAGAPAAGGGGTVFVALHVADYERLRLYVAPEARDAIVQVQIDRYTRCARRR
jgi:hypothetical protein